MWSQQFNGALPEPGGLLDQNAVVMEALSIVHAEREKADAWKMHEERTNYEKDRHKKKSRS